MPIQNLASLTKLFSPNFAKREYFANIRKPLASDIANKYFGDSLIHSSICLKSIFPQNNFRVTRKKGRMVHPLRTPFMKKSLYG